VVKSWLGFCALGAGLIHVALGIDSPPVFGVPLLLMGIAEVAWGVFALTAAALPLPRVTRVAAMVPLLFWVVVLIIGTGSPLPGVRVVPMLVATLLDLTIAVAITAMLRRRSAAGDRALPPARSLLALAGGALVVAALTVPALVTTGDLPTGTPLDLPAHGH
jgi:hypothetical protein